MRRLTLLPLLILPLLAAAQEELALKKEGSRPEVIRAAEAQVMQAQAELAAR